MSYVYAYIIDNKFRYIGKGTGDRDVSHLKCVNNTNTKNHFHKVRNSDDGPLSSYVTFLNIASRYLMFYN